MKILLVTFASLLSIANSSEANICKFTEVDSIMGKSWLVDNGTTQKLWPINPLPGVYTMAGDESGGCPSCPVPEGIVVCRKLGAKLPTQQDFSDLHNCFAFNHNETRTMTSEGLSEFYQRFPDMKKKQFWTSTPHEIYSTSMRYVFRGQDGSDVYVDMVSYANSVMCLIPR